MNIKLSHFAFLISCLLSYPALSQISPGTICEGGAVWPSTYPSWWYNAEDPANGVIDATLPELNESNFSPLNQGQLLNLVSIAIDTMNTQLASFGGATFDISNFINNVSPDYNAPINIGQLKFVSSFFFDRFAEVGFTPESPGWPNTLILDEGSNDQVPNYPWLRNTCNGNLCVANLGQAKHLFSWDLSLFIDSLSLQDVNI